MQHSSNETNHAIKTGAGLNRHFSKEDTQIASRDMKRFSTTNHQRDANQNHHGLSPHIYLKGYYQKDKK